jgi:hypothetical protein
MSNTYEGITTILVPSVDVNVDLNTSDSSTTTIGTDYLGSCICFLFDFILKGKPMCVLDHYTYSKDEKDLSPEKVLALFMENFVDAIKYHLNLEPLQQISSSTTIISNVRLLVVGGDPRQSRLIRNTPRFKICDRI